MDQEHAHRIKDNAFTGRGDLLKKFRNSNSEAGQVRRLVDIPDMRVRNRCTPRVMGDRIDDEILIREYSLLCVGFDQYLAGLVDGYNKGCATYSQALFDDHYIHGVSILRGR